MEYVFSNAAVARSFTEYLSFTFGQNNPNVWRVEVPVLPKDYNMLDFPAVALILILTLCLCHRLDLFLPPFLSFFLLLFTFAMMYIYLLAYILFGLTSISSRISFSTQKLLTEFLPKINFDFGTNCKKISKHTLSHPSFT